MTTGAAAIGRRIPTAKRIGLCHACSERFPFRPAFFKRMWPATRLERFLQSCGIGVTPLNHALMHVRKRYGFDVRHLDAIRRGTEPASFEERCAIQLAVSSLLGTVIPMGELFEADSAEVTLQ